jgi:hypothetical protein
MVAVIVALLTTLTLTALTSTITVAPARNPVPLIVTCVDRTVEPQDGEIAVTVGALGAAGASGVGADGDRPSQAANPIARTTKQTAAVVLYVMTLAYSTNPQMTSNEVSSQNSLLTAKREMKTRT